MITYQSIPMNDLTFQQENELMLKHIGKIINIPHYHHPNKLTILRNEFLKKKYVTIFCTINAKSEWGKRATYDFSLTL